MCSTGTRSHSAPVFNLPRSSQCTIGGKHYRNWGPHWQMAQLFGYLGLFGEMLQMLFCGRDPEAREARLSSPWVFTLCTLTQPPPFTAPHRAHRTKLKTSPPSALVVCVAMLSFSALCLWLMPNLLPVFHSWPVSVTQSPNDMLCFPTHCHGIFCSQL